MGDVHYVVSETVSSWEWLPLLDEREDTSKRLSLRQLENCCLGSSCPMDTSNPAPPVSCLTVSCEHDRQEMEFQMNLANRFSLLHCMTRAMVWISDYSTTPRKTRQNIVSYQFSNRQRHDKPRQQSSSCFNGSPLLLFSCSSSRGSHSHEDKVSETTYWTSPKMAYSWSPVESERRQMNHSLSTSFCFQRNLD